MILKNNQTIKIILSIVTFLCFVLKSNAQYNQRPTTQFNNIVYSQDFTQGEDSRESIPFFKQWTVLGTGDSWDANTTNGYLEFSWPFSRVMASKTSDAGAYKFSANMRWVEPRSGIALRVDLNDLDGLQAPGMIDGVPNEWNRNGIGIRSNTAGDSFNITFIAGDPPGVPNTTPVKEVSVPKPSEITTTLRETNYNYTIEDYGSTIYVSIGNTEAFKMNLSSQVGNYYTAAEIIKPDNTVASSLIGIKIPVTGSVGMGQRASALHLYDVEISNSNSNPIVILNDFPETNQLYPRDRTDNTAKIKVNGTVDKSNDTVEYNLIGVRLYREGILQTDNSLAITYNNDTAAFDFELTINAELVNYKVELYAKAGADEYIVKTAENVVAGDAYIIQGQSNASAIRYPGSLSSEIYKNDFIRVFKSGTNNKSELVSDNNWHIAQGDGDFVTNGNTGQWGLVLANKIVTTENIPVAIFNGAQGGNPIKYFARPTDYKTSLDSNYSRLYYRINETNFKNAIRAVIWSQGEGNMINVNDKLTTNEYKTAFTDLKDNMLEDYPSIEQFYILQSRIGCNADTSERAFLAMNILEAHRQLGYENGDTTVLPTSAFNQRAEDKCHYLFTGGYEAFGKRVFGFISRDVYGKSTELEIDPPMITSATYLKTSNEIELVTDATSLSIPTYANIQDANFFINGDNTLIQNISVTDNKILIVPNTSFETAPTISYYGPLEGDNNFNFITNTNDVELIPFKEFQSFLNDALSLNENDLFNTSLKVYPNPVKDIINLSANNEIKDISIYNLLGQKVLESAVNSRDFSLDISSLKTGIYIVKVVINESVRNFKIVKE